MWEAISSVFKFLLETFKYFFNPKKRNDDELRKIKDEIAQLERQRDEALAKNNSDALTAITARLIFLRNKAKDYLP
jgi:hypothetical protein